MPKPEHHGDWTAIAAAVKGLLEANAGRPRSAIYEDIGAIFRANPAIVRRAYAATQALKRLPTSMMDIGKRIERLPLAAAEPIIRLIAVNAKEAAVVLNQYEARKIGVRDLRARVMTAQNLRPDSVRIAVAASHKVVRQRLIAEFGHHPGFDFEEIKTGRPRGVAGQFPELSGAGVDFIATWGRSPQHKLVIFVVSSTSPDKNWGFRRRLMANVWTALGMIRARWRVIIAVFGNTEISVAERFVRELGVDAPDLEFWHFPQVNSH